MKIEKLERVSIGVKNLAEAEKFFSDVFGLTFTKSPTDVKRELLLNEPISDEHRAFIGKSRKASHSRIGLELVEKDPPVANEGVRVIYFKVDNLEAAKAEMKKKGIRLLHEEHVGKMRQALYGPIFGCRIDLVEYEGPSALDAILRK
ncbi:MAG: VOC family protein [Chloroflexota bacterium]